MTEQEARQEARRRWGSEGDVIHDPAKPIPCWVGYWCHPPDSHKYFETVACGYSWEGAFRAADFIASKLQS